MAKNKVRQAPPTIVRETHPNPDIRSFHVNFRISKYGHIHTFANPFALYEKKYLKETGRVGTKLVNALQGDNGIDEITLQPFELSIKRGLAFRWDQIEPIIFDSLQSVAGVERIKVLSKQDFQDAEIPLFSRFLRWIQWPKHA